MIVFAPGGHEARPYIGCALRRAAGEVVRPVECLQGLVDYVEVDGARGCVVVEVVDGLDGHAVGAGWKIFHADDHACGNDRVAFVNEIVEGLDAGEGELLVRGAVGDAIGEADAGRLVAGEERLVDLRVHDDVIVFLETIRGGRNDFEALDD